MHSNKTNFWENTHLSYLQGHLSELTPPDLSGFKALPVLRVVYFPGLIITGDERNRFLFCVEFQKRADAWLVIFHKTVNCKIQGKSSICWSSFWRSCWRQALASCSQMRWLHSVPSVADRKAKTHVETIADRKQPGLMSLMGWHSSTKAVLIIIGSGAKSCIF